MNYRIKKRVHDQLQLKENSSQFVNNDFPKLSLNVPQYVLTKERQMIKTTNEDANTTHTNYINYDIWKEKQIFVDHVGRQ